MVPQVIPYDTITIISPYSGKHTASFLRSPVIEARTLTTNVQTGLGVTTGLVVVDTQVVDVDAVLSGVSAVLAFDLLTFAYNSRRTFRPKGYAVDGTSGLFNPAMYRLELGPPSNMCTDTFPMFILEPVYPVYVRVFDLTHGTSAKMRVLFRSFPLL